MASITGTQSLLCRGRYCAKTKDDESLGAIQLSRTNASRLATPRRERGIAQLSSARLRSARRECSNEHDAWGEIKPRFASPCRRYMFAFVRRANCKRAPKAYSQHEPSFLPFPSKLRHTLCTYQLLLLHCSILSLNRRDTPCACAVINIATCNFCLLFLSLMFFQKV